MTVDFDMSQYLNIFLDETEEQLQILDEALILLEQERENEELLNKIFRAAHTLKGSSASMGFEKMAQLTHVMESVLDKLRQGELSVTKEVIDHLLAGLDALKELKTEIVSGQDKQIDVSPLISSLKNHASGFSGKGTSEGEGCFSCPIEAGLLLDDVKQCGDGGGSEGLPYLACAGDFDLRLPHERSQGLYCF